MQNLDFLLESNLAFIDIEATDKKGCHKIVQFSGIRVNLDGTTQTINLFINPQQPLSNYILNLLKIDDQYLLSQPTFSEQKNTILQFLKEAIVVSFGDFDKKLILDHLNNDANNLKFFDFQHYLKRFSKNNVSLVKMHKLITNNTIHALQHDAFYDALMLKDLFYKTLNFDEEELKYLCSISHVMPQEISPKHKIFSKADFIVNSWSNKPFKKGKFIFVSKLVINKFEMRSTKSKETISYLQEISYLVYEDNKFHECNWKNFILVGTYMYDVYKDETKKFLNNLLDEIKSKPLFFNSINKDTILKFVEIIYDITNKYITLSFINLNYITKKWKCMNPLEIFYEMIDKLPPKLKTKFDDFTKD